MRIEYVVEEQLVEAAFPVAYNECPMSSFSGGEVNRALLARALADEPANHLDVGGYRGARTVTRAWSGSMLVCLARSSFHRNGCRRRSCELAEEQRRRSHLEPFRLNPLIQAVYTRPLKLHLVYAKLQRARVDWIPFSLRGVIFTYHCREILAPRRTTALLIL